MTHYKIIYQVGESIRVMMIEAASPFLAFKKFKQVMNTITFDALLINEIEGIDNLSKNKRRKNDIQRSFPELQKV